MVSLQCVTSCCGVIIKQMSIYTYSVRVCLCLCTGLNLDVEASVGTYVIDSNDSSFRHWVDTKGPATNAEVVSTNCFTAIRYFFRKR